MMPTGRVHISEVPAALLMFSPMKRKNGPIKMPPPTPNSEERVPTNPPNGNAIVYEIGFSTVDSADLKKSRNEIRKINRANIFLNNSLSSSTDIRAPITGPITIPSKSLRKLTQEIVPFLWCTGIAERAFTIMHASAVPREIGIAISSE